MCCWICFLKDAFLDGFLDRLNCRSSKSTPTLKIGYCNMVRFSLALFEKTVPNTFLEILIKKYQIKKTGYKNSHINIDIMGSDFNNKLRRWDLSTYNLWKLFVRFAFIYRSTIKPMIFTRLSPHQKKLKNMQKVKVISCNSISSEAAIDTSFHASTWDINCVKLNFSF